MQVWIPLFDKDPWHAAVWEPGFGPEYPGVQDKKYEKYVLAGALGCMGLCA